MSLATLFPTSFSLRLGTMIIGEFSLLFNKSIHFLNVVVFWKLMEITLRVLVKVFNFTMGCLFILVCKINLIFVRLIHTLREATVVRPFISVIPIVMLISINMEVQIILLAFTKFIDCLLLTLLFSEALLLVFSHALASESVLEGLMIRIKFVSFAIEVHFFLCETVNIIEIFVLIITFITFDVIALFVVRFLFWPLYLEFLLLVLIVREIHVSVAKLTPIFVKRVALVLSRLFHLLFRVDVTTLVMGGFFPFILIVFKFWLFSFGLIALIIIIFHLFFIQLVFVRPIYLILLFPHELVEIFSILLIKLLLLFSSLPLETVWRESFLNIILKLFFIIGSLTIIIILFIIR